MQETDKYRLKILKTYSIMVEFDGAPHRSNVPGPIKDETFAQWKKRVLGPGVSNVSVLAPWEPASQTRMHTVQGWSDLEWPKLIAREVTAKKNQERDRLVSKETDKVRKSYDRFSAETLHDLVSTMETDLHPAAKEFIGNRLAQHKDLDTRELVGSLIRAYNSALCELRTQRHANQSKQRIAMDDHDLSGPSVK
ncbi:hypothetical protein OU994_10415 [Pseudoduganella sp. SL102]|uniref:hypothetical protein n=1 Tax=Pseudoduganella sp. SL102 TaxID=2995154 RepID=UPI00248B78CD|nr:hypothetical protein [Pseudoduganella sp. SL102]WBS04654.1 hypothetical protein OU994_10415 [Pseudoduganella sp. SL102]